MGAGKGPLMGGGGGTGYGCWYGGEDSKVVLHMSVDIGVYHT
jgi:hypothetical protein